MEASQIDCLRCCSCGMELQPQPSRYLCPNDGGTLEVIFAYDRIKKLFNKKSLETLNDQSMWRYLPLLPVHESTVRKSLSSLPSIGGTPLIEAPSLRGTSGFRRIYLKDETRNPTASLKDRASAIAVLRALDEGATAIATASTGNAASSLAGIAASQHLPVKLFVPQDTPPAKLVQMVAYGAEIFMVDGSYDDAFDLCIDACKQYHWYNRNTGINPFVSEGKKTTVLEICEQLHWVVPSKIFIPVGDGSILSGIWKGLRDLFALKMIDHFPTLIGVQAEGSSALTKAWRSGLKQAEKIVPSTFADSLSVSLPRDGIHALNAIQECDGRFVTISDEEIREAQLTLARNTGIFAEPAGAAAFAGLCHEPTLSSEETAVVLVTGSGLKTPESIRIDESILHRVAPNLKSVTSYISA